MQLSKISNQLLLRMLFVIALYILLGVGVYFLALSIFTQFIWQGDELLYRIINWFNQRIILWAALYIILGCCIIFSHYWKKPFAFLHEILNAAESIYQPDDDLIELSTPLNNVEAQLNQLKMTVRNNERIARDAEQRKNDLVAYLAHDLKTPITSLIGYLTLLKDEGQISRELQNRYLTISLDKAERLDELINEFFEITRFNLSHISLEYERVNLMRMLEQLVFEFKPMLAEKNLECELTAPADIMLRCDADKLQRAFDNLLRNAVSYSFENSRILITAAVSEDKAAIAFENKGNTISPEKLNRIFEQFYRLDSARSSKSGGAGLGLAIAKEIVELHHGSISAFSENEIIRFEVNLPLA